MNRTPQEYALFTAVGRLVIEAKLALLTLEDPKAHECLAKALRDYDAANRAWQTQHSPIGQVHEQEPYKEAAE